MYHRRRPLQTLHFSIGRFSDFPVDVCSRNRRGTYCTPVFKHSSDERILIGRISSENVESERNWRVDKLSADPHDPGISTKLPRFAVQTWVELY